MTNEEIEKSIKKFALQNAIFYGGKANPKAVSGKVLAEEPDLRPRAKEILPLINDIVTAVNQIPLEEQRRMLGAIDASLLKKDSKERVHALPDLPDSVQGMVIMRFAPGPSGPLHLGHTRVAILNDEYCRRYDGCFINRVEDTNPDRIDPEAYEMIPEDLEWLGIKVGMTVIQSDRFELYYDVARQLINLKNAYVCTCAMDDWRKLKEEMKPCPHRDLDSSKQMEEFENMLAGKYEEEKAVLVVKTDLHHPNPAIRDFVGLRIVTSTPHPRTGSRYCVYPMMNFSVAVDDHLLGLTHVIRGKDHLNNTHRQEYIFHYFGWQMPWYHHYGLVSIPETILKTSTVGKGIKTGEYSGWDDVRLGTVRALAKRGFLPEAIRAYWIDMGIKDVDVEFTWDTLYAYDRDRLDKGADRYFFVWDPVELDIYGTERLESHAPIHPEFPERGVRRNVMTGEPIRVYVVKDDLGHLDSRGRVRLKDLCNIKIEDGRVTYIGNDLGILKEKVKIIHWVPGNALPGEVLMPDGTKKIGLVEPIKTQVDGKVVQFERFGFARVERSYPTVKAYFTHQ